MTILVGSGVISGSFMNLVEGQSNSIVTNVTDLTRADVSNAGVD
jgi:carboxymethylenebutenolidase